jgi:DNA-binding response OmpR family regulator
MQDTIVIFEPDDLMRDLLERWLRDAGYGVHRFDDVADATRPAMVIADLPDPGDAEPLLARLRTRYDVPILALSTRFRRGLAGSGSAAQRLRVDKVLPKPFTRVELLSAVLETIALSR